ncbi:TIGR03943 family putative permease subunit [Streptomyces maoxianensis]|uniref:TIGR03943 family putative permease subunit n=1 Tax=Streptomyces maoxianensis TaxID=1459942 RepID=A0ABV9G396_9ACTN
MKRTVQAALLLLTGAGVLRVSLFSDICLRYVKEGLQPFLIVSGVALVGLGLIGAVRDGLPCAEGRRSGDAHRSEAAYAHEGHEGHGHDHSHGPRIAWLLLLPTLALLFFAPPALGSYTAARDNAKVVEDYSGFEPLPSRGPAPLSLTEFIARAQQDDQQSLMGRSVLLAGFVTPGKGGVWDLTRLLVACCAADSQSLTVTMHGVKAPPADTWVKVTGTWHPEGTLGTASAGIALDVTSLQRIPPPPSPYLDRAPVSNSASPEAG